MVKNGFYVYRNNIYYGCYDEGQVSGRWKISGIGPERIRTDHPIGEEDWAVRLWDNHSLLEAEYADLRGMLSKMRRFMDLNAGKEPDFSAVERRLGVSFPRELRQIYTAIWDRDIYFIGAEHFLPPDEIYVEQGIMVFFKKKRTSIAGYVLESGRLATYYKKEWGVERGGFCCYQFCVGRMLTMALESRPVVRKGRCKGRFVTTLDIEKELEAFCGNQYHLLPEFNVYGIAVMYSDEGLIAWIRSNGFYADIHAGSMTDAELDAFGEHLENIVWKQ